MKMLSLTDRKEIAVEQVSLVLGTKLCDLVPGKWDRCLSSRSASVSEEGRDGCANQAPTICCMPWSTPSSINILPSRNHVGEKIELLQQTVVDDPKPETLNEIHALKRQLLFVRRAVWPFAM